MVRPQTDSERSYKEALIRLGEAEKTARAAEKIIAGHPMKIEAKRRQLRDLKNTMFHSDYDQNSRANRESRKSDVERDLSTLENELSYAQSALRTARVDIETARGEASQAGADFTIERDRILLDDAFAKRETDQARLAIAQRGQKLAERKYAQVERDKLEAAKNQLTLAEQQGATTMELERYRANVTAANLQFEWQQRQEMAAYEAKNRASEIAVSNGHEIELATLQGDIARENSILSHGQALEIIKANEISDIGRIAANGKEHRLNVTHETNEDIRKAVEMMALTTQKGITDTLNAAKLLVLKHYLRKDEMSHALKIGQEARAEELDSVAADMAEIARWQANREKSKPDFEEPNT